MAHQRKGDPIVYVGGCRSQIGVYDTNTLSVVGQVDNCPTHHHRPRFVTETLFAVSSYNTRNRREIELIDSSNNEVVRRYRYPNGNSYFVHPLVGLPSPEGGEGVLFSSTSADSFVYIWSSSDEVANAMIQTPPQTTPFGAVAPPWAPNQIFVYGVLSAASPFPVVVYDVETHNVVRELVGPEVRTSHGAGEIDIDHSVMLTTGVAECGALHGWDSRIEDDAEMVFHVPLTKGAYGLFVNNLASLVTVYATDYAVGFDLRKISGDEKDALWSVKLPERTNDSSYCWGSLTQVEEDRFVSAAYGNLCLWDSHGEIRARVNEQGLFGVCSPKYDLPPTPRAQQWLHSSLLVAAEEEKTDRIDFGLTMERSWIELVAGPNRIRCPRTAFPNHVISEDDVIAVSLPEIELVDQEILVRILLGFRAVPKPSEIWDMYQILMSLGLKKRAYLVCSMLSEEKLFSLRDLLMCYQKSFQKGQSSPAFNDACFILLGRKEADIRLNERLSRRARRLKLLRRFKRNIVDPSLLLHPDFALDIDQDLVTWSLVRRELLLRVDNQELFHDVVLESKDGDRIPTNLGIVCSELNFISRMLRFGGQESSRLEEEGVIPISVLEGSVLRLVLELVYRSKTKCSDLYVLLSALRHAGMFEETQLMSRITSRLKKLSVEMICIDSFLPSLVEVAFLLQDCPSAFDSIRRFWISRKFLASGLLSDLVDRSVRNQKRREEQEQAKREFQGLSNRVDELTKRFDSLEQTVEMIRRLVSGEGSEEDGGV